MHLELVTSDSQPDAQAQSAQLVTTRRLLLSLLVLGAVAAFVGWLFYIQAPATAGEIAAVDPASCEGNLLRFTLAEGTVARADLMVGRYVCAQRKEDGAIRNSQQAAFAHGQAN